MKRFLIVGAVAFVATGQALAADLPPPMAPPPRAPAAYVPAPVPFYNWGGIYVGINGGYGFGSTANSTVGVAGNTLVPTGTYTLSGNNFSGGLAGGTVGFNYQWAAIVAGIEGDWDWSGQSRSGSVGCGAGCTLNDSSKLPWIATARGRLGYAFDRILVFGTGGVAFTNASDNGSVTTGGRHHHTLEPVVHQCGLDCRRWRRSGVGSELDRQSRISLRPHQRDAKQHHQRRGRSRNALGENHGQRQPCSRRRELQVQSLKPTANLS